MNAMQPGTALDRLGEALEAHPAAEQALAAEHDPARFEARALDFAARHGIAIPAGDLSPALRAVPKIAEHWPGPGWLPIALGDQGVDWAHFAGTKPGEPFFDDSVRRATARPFNRLFRRRTPLDAFIAHTPEAPQIPRGLIFHMSRCGSTLAAQMLGAAPGNVVLAEAQPFDAALALPPEHRRDTLHALAAAFGRGHANSFIKTDAWHIRMLPAMLEAFPDTPWAFLYRDPVEVLASHARMPGRQVVPGVVPALQGLVPDVHGLEYAGRILALLCETALEHHAAGGGILVNHSELPDALFTRILPHFGMAPSAAERAAMARAGGRDAKAPHEPFRADSAAKRECASEAVRAAARHLAPVYAELEAIRAASRPAAA